MGIIISFCTFKSLFSHWMMTFFILILTHTVRDILGLAHIIMHPNRRFTNKVSMMIFNLEVININGYICFLYVVFLNKQIFAIYADKFITNKKTSCIDKTPALNVERVIISCYNFFTINCEMNKLVYFAHISLKNSLRCGFKRVEIR